MDQPELEKSLQVGAKYSLLVAPTHRPSTPAN
jgi:hypothetical protein